MNAIQEAVLAVAIGFGFVAALAALYGRYRVLPAFLTGPNICKREEGGCQVLFRTPNAALLRVPNSALGALYYPLLAAGSLLGWPIGLLLIGSSAAFAMTLWLAWILVRDKLECRICWTGHVCNTAIWLVLLVRVLRS